MSRSNHARWAGGLWVVCLAAASGGGVAGAAERMAPQPPALPGAPLSRDAGSPFTIYPVRGGIYMITGAGGNTTVSIGHDGILVVDPGMAAAAPGLIAQIRRLSDGAIRQVLDTNGDPDHSSGNQAVAEAGQLMEGANRRPVGYGSGGAAVWAHEKVLLRLSAAGGVAAGLPTDTYYVAQKNMFVNGEPVQMFAVPAGHTDGDSFVMFRRSDVIAAGDIYTPDRYPVIDLVHGGSINGLIDGLNTLLRLTVPEFALEGGTLVVPGHGRLSDASDIAEYRDMVTIIRDRIQDMINRKLTLEQIKAAKPTFDYDPEFGIDNGRVFIEQVYRTLAKPTRKKIAADRASQ